MSKREKKEQSKAKKIYNIISTVIVAVVFVFLVVIVSLMMWQRKSGGDSSIFGYYIFDVVTDSMSGTIEQGEVIVSKKVEDAESLKAGDIITFIAPSGQLKGRNITHRIVEVVRAEDGSVLYFKTKGDNPSVGIDEWRLSPSNIKAVYLHKSVFIGGLRRFLSHWYGYVLLIALPLCIVGILLIVGYVRDRLEKENAANAEKKVALDDMSEEQKRKLLEDYLKSDKPSDERAEEDDARRDSDGKTE